MLIFLLVLPVDAIAVADRGRHAACEEDHGSAVGMGAGGHGTTFLQGALQHNQVLGARKPHFC